MILMDLSVLIRARVYHSKDDEKCDFVDGEFYHKNLPKSQFIVFTNKGHFDQTTFPELIKNIDKL